MIQSAAPKRPPLLSPAPAAVAGNAPSAAAPSGHVAGAGCRGLAASAHNLFPGVKRLTDKVVVSASGSYVHTSDGEKLLDFTAGIGVTATGHCHPAVARAVAEQAAAAVHVQQSCYMSSTVLELVDALCWVLCRAAGSAASACATLRAVIRMLLHGGVEFRLASAYHLNVLGAVILQRLGIDQRSIRVGQRTGSSISL